MLSSPLARQTFGGSRLETARLSLYLWNDLTWTCMLRSPLVRQTFGGSRLGTARSSLYLWNDLTWTRQWLRTLAEPSTRSVECFYLDSTGSLPLAEGEQWLWMNSDHAAAVVAGMVVVLVLVCIPLVRPAAAGAWRLSQCRWVGFPLVPK